jgi:hypothetical protein
MITILPEFEQLYFDKIELGKNFIKDKKIIILGLVRNLENSLYDNVVSISTISKYCSNISFFLYENDSIDNTANVLKKCKLEIKNFNYLSDTLNLRSFGHQTLESKLELKSTERTLSLAKHRNVCLSYVRDNSDKFDFVIVMDMDFEKFSLDGILNSFGWFSENYADALVGTSLQFKNLFSSEQKNLWNYDCWAYRGSWWEDLQKYSNNYGYDPMLWFGFWQLPIGSKPIQVNSAFGGIGIYKTQHYINVEYEGHDCEHVCLHKNLKNKYPDYKLCINPSQLMLFI